MPAQAPIDDKPQSSFLDDFLSPFSNPLDSLGDDDDKEKDQDQQNNNIDKPKDKKKDKDKKEDDGGDDDSGKENESKETTDKEGPKEQGEKEEKQPEGEREGPEEGSEKTPGENKPELNDGPSQAPEKGEGPSESKEPTAKEGGEGSEGGPSDKASNFDEGPREGGARPSTGQGENALGDAGGSTGQTGANTSGEAASTLGEEGLANAGNTAANTLSTAGSAGNAVGGSAATAGAGAGATGAGVAGAGAAGAAGAGNLAAGTTAASMATTAATTAATTTGAAAGGATTGAALGSVVPGAGTAIGLALGAATGLFQKQIKALLKNSGMATIGLIILLTLAGNMAFAFMGAGAIKGGGAKSGQVPVKPGASETESVLDASKQPASVPVGGGNSGTGTSSDGGKLGKLENRSGFPVTKYKRLEFSKRDEEFLRNVLGKGFDDKDGSRFDWRVVNALIYLANRHQHIKVSNIVYQYEDMPVDFENTSNSQVIANISAHVTGQAADIRQIDFIYVGLDIIGWAQGKCGPPETTDKVDIVWFNEDNGSYNELLRQRCMGSITQTSQYTGGPPVPSMGGVILTKAIPIQIAWQDEQPKQGASSSGTQRGSAEGYIERILKLPPGSLDRSNGYSSLVQIGLAEIAQQLNIDPSFMEGSTTTDLVVNIGQGGIEKKLGLPAGSLGGVNLESIVPQTGYSTMEELFNLPLGSWKGNDIQSLVNSVGKRSFEREFGMPEGTLDNAAMAKAYIGKELLSAVDAKKIAVSLNLPEDLVVGCINAAKSGALDSGYFSTYGIKKLGRALQMKDGLLDEYVASANGTREVSLKELLNGEGILLNLETQINLENIDRFIDKELVKRLFTSLGKGEDVSAIIKEIGGQQLDNAFSLVPGTTLSFLQTADGSPRSQLEKSTNQLGKDAGNSLFTNDFTKFLADYGQDYLSDALQRGPRNSTVLISEEQKTKINNDPLAAAEEIGSHILKTNAKLSGTDIEKMKGSKIQEIPSVESVLKDYKMTDSDIDSVPNRDLIGMPRFKNEIIKSYGLDEDDYLKFTKGDIEHMNTAEEEAAKKTGISKDDIEFLVSRDLKAVSFVRTVLKNSYGLTDEQINNKNNSEIANMPEVRSTVSTKMKFSGDDWTNYLSGNVLATNLFKGIAAEKLSCTQEDANKMKGERAKDVAAIRNPIKNTPLSIDDFKYLKQGNIKALPPVRNTLKSEFKLNDQELDSLFIGDFKNIGMVKTQLSQQLNINEDDVIRLLDRDFVNLQFARTIVKEKLKVTDSDIDLILRGDVGHVSVIQSEIAKRFKISEEEVRLLMDSHFRQSQILQNVAKQVLHLSQEKINKIRDGISSLPGVKQGFINDLVGTGLVNRDEAAKVVDGNWLGSGLVKSEVAKMFDISVGEAQVIELGFMEDLSTVFDLTLDKFNLDSFGLENLTSGSWGVLSFMQNGFSEKFNLPLSEIQELVAGAIISFEPLQDIFENGFELSNLDLSNITGIIDFGDLGFLGDFGNGFNIWKDQFANILGGSGVPTDILNLGGIIDGGVFNGGGIFGGGGVFGGGVGGVFGGGQNEVMNKVMRPEARRKVHQVIGELLDITTNLKEPNMLIMQLITYSKPRDVDPFESKLQKLYGKLIKEGGDRKSNYGLFSMKEAFPNIHIGY